MRTLYHQLLCPFSRAVRIVLGEKKLPFEMVEEHPWDRREDFLRLNPAGEVPVLVEPDGAVLSDSRSIAEYLDETLPDPPLLGHEPPIRAEVRRLIGWFDGKFCREVTVPLVGEKLMKRLRRTGDGPDSRLIRAGFTAIHEHISYIGWLAEERRWLAGDVFSWPTSPPPRICPASTISAMCRGNCQRRPKIGMRGSNRAPASARCWRTACPTFRRLNIIPIRISETDRYASRPVNSRSTYSGTFCVAGP